MEFREALDAVGISAPQGAEVFGVGAQTIRQMRLEPTNPGYRTPPANWQKTLAKWIRVRKRELTRIAEQLEREQ